MKERKLNQYDERGDCFKSKQGLQGRKRQGRQMNGEKDERAPCSFKCKLELQGRKRHGRQIDGEKDETCAMQFQVQAGAPGKKTSGAPNWRRKGRDGCHAVSSASRGFREENVRGAKLTEKRTRRVHHAVSSASRGFREENVRGAKLTEKRTRGAPCSFKCKQGLQGRKRQGRQINGEKDERGAMQFKVQAEAPGKKMSGAPNRQRKEQKMRHAVSSASRGSREENVRGAKLTEKRTRGVPCSFKCKQGL